MADDNQNKDTEDLDEGNGPMDGPLEDDSFGGGGLEDLVQSGDFGEDETLVGGLGEGEDDTGFPQDTTHELEDSTGAFDEGFGVDDDEIDGDLDGDHVDAIEFDSTEEESIPEADDEPDLGEYDYGDDSTEYDDDDSDVEQRKKKGDLIFKGGIAAVTVFVLAVGYVAVSSYTGSSPEQSQSTADRFNSSTSISSQQNNTSQPASSQTAQNQVQQAQSGNQDTSLSVPGNESQATQTSERKATSDEPSLVFGGTNNEGTSADGEQKPDNSAQRSQEPRESQGDVPPARTLTAESNEGAGQPSMDTIRRENIVVDMPKEMTQSLRRIEERMAEVARTNRQVANKIEKLTDRLDQLASRVANAEQKIQQLSDVTQQMREEMDARESRLQEMAAAAAQQATSQVSQTSPQPSTQPAQRVNVPTSYQGKSMDPGKSGEAIPTTESEGDSSWTVSNQQSDGTSESEHIGNVVQGWTLSGHARGDVYIRREGGNIIRVRIGDAVDGLGEIREVRRVNGRNVLLTDAGVVRN